LNTKTKPRQKLARPLGGGEDVPPSLTDRGQLGGSFLFGLSGQQDYHEETIPRSAGKSRDFLLPYRRSNTFLKPTSGIMAPSCTLNLDLLLRHVSGGFEDGAGLHFGDLPGILELKMLGYLPFVGSG
jgi:hypothetical protein